ncbi:penicillin-binding protein 2 [Agrobacterium tumefaciens]|uniref:peptidoglycan D,D-transpeptidase FtsI family protein n=1 Tax=Agrobacterium tumefaciens TaxID=358 RepID=UPI0012B87916|nr:penicillin-binding protein 2 [Agrobacterium tumefaciens]MQB04445.1 penicillin-binding protein 2 [Agrobacterium tumefaciens]
MSYMSRILAARSQSNFALSKTVAGHSAIGARNARSRIARSRILVLVMCFVTLYGIVGLRLMQYGLASRVVTSSLGNVAIPASRPEITDRNGEMLATDLDMVSLYAEPRRIVDVDEAVEKLASVVPQLDWQDTYRKLKSQSAFQWLRRQLTPRQQADILALGIPGIGFRPEKRRFYPGGSTAAHILGHVNVDNRGLAGMERYLDQEGLMDLRASGITGGTALEPVRLSIDLRVQSIVHEVITKAMIDYQAEAAGAVVLDADTGEVLAMASVPDYDPNQPSRTLPDGSVDKEYEKGWFNRMSNATFEMGSTFKSFTLAMGLDEGKVTLNSVIDASKPLQMAGFTIKDDHGQYRPLTVPEIFQYSSNIGTAGIASLVEIGDHQAFLKRLGLLSKMKTELPEVATPSQPRVWRKINQATISFGHGVATTPLQTAVAGAALVNGGKLIEPTFLPRSRDQADAIAHQVVKSKTSSDMRYLFHWNGVKGSGRNARVPGYNVGGKTGTADKVVNGRYAAHLNFNAFLAAFPIDKPRYVVLTIIDAPLTGEKGGRLAAYTAAPMAKAIISRSATLLGVQPRFGDDDGGESLLVNY